MTLNEKQRLCMGCMSVALPDGKCSRCGYQDGNPYSCEYLPPRTELGKRYLVGRLLSHNGEGASYIGYDMEEERKVLVVEYAPLALSTRSESNGRVLPRAGKEAQFKSLLYDFIENAQILRELGTKMYRLQTVLDTIDQNGTAYVIYRYIQAEPLSSYLMANGGELEWSRVKPMLMPLLQAVAALHQKGAVHGGISTSTVVVDADGKLWLTGFAISAGRTGMSEIDCELFEGYSAPEQYSANGWQGTWTDVYACAAVAYRMLTGTKPVSADIRKEKDSLYPANMLNAAIPDDISDAIDCAMLVPVEKRTQSIDQMIAGLLEAPNSNTAVFDAQEYVIPAQKPAPKKWSFSAMPFWLRVMLCTSALLLVVVMIYVRLLAPMLSAPEESSQDETTSSQEVSDEVSSEPEPEVMGAAVPDFTGQFLQKVQNSTLYTDKYEFIVKEEYNEDDVPAGVIYDQSPEKGTPMLNKGSVILYVSKGSQVTKMPNLIGSTRELAERTLYEMKILCDIEYLDDDDLKPGLVINTSVEPGQDIIKEQDMVILYLKKEEESVVISQP